MAKIGRYIVSNTNQTGKYPNRVRIALDGVVLAQVVSEHRNPYHWACKWPSSPEALALVEQLRKRRVPADEIRMLMTPQRLSQK